MKEPFPRLTSRLHFIQLCPDMFKNLEAFHRLSIVEHYTYGIASQFERIKEDLEPIYSPDHQLAGYSSTQLGLDVYYYVLTWDKLREVYSKFAKSMADIQRAQNTVPAGFNQEFRELRVRIDHLFGEFDKDVRNEYEHPSLEFRRTGNILEWGSLYLDKDGNISVHVGKELFAIVRKEHVDRLKLLWISLVDVFIKHFTDRPPSSVLLELKKQTEDNIDLIIQEYLQAEQEERREDTKQIFEKFITCDMHLSKEGVPLSDVVRNRFYENIFPIKPSGPS